MCYLLTPCKAPGFESPVALVELMTVPHFSPAIQARVHAHHA